MIRVMIDTDRDRDWAGGPLPVRAAAVTGQLEAGAASDSESDSAGESAAAPKVGLEA